MLHYTQDTCSPLTAHQVAYQRILQLSYVDDLLAAIKALFIKLYNPFLTSFVASLHASASATSDIISESSPSWDFVAAFKGWDKVFDKVLRDLEQKANQERRLRARQLAVSPDSGSFLSEDAVGPSGSGDTTPALDTAQPIDGQEIAKNIASMKSRLKSRTASGGGKRGKGHVGSGSDSDVTPRKGGASGKKQVKRTWGDVVPTEDDMSALDFSTDKPGDFTSDNEIALSGLVDESARGTKKDGIYEVKDWEFSKRKQANGSAPQDDDDEVDDDFITRTLQATSLSSGNSKEQDTTAQPGYVSSLFSRLTGLAGSTRPLTKEDLAPVLAGMKDHLMKKNVARDIAERVCDGVGKSLEGSKVGGFKSIKTQVRNALEDSITRILTPKTSTDILHQIRQKKLATTGSDSKMDPYTLTFVGVNGVGKSTNLSKVAFWLLQNDFKVLIAACDTFRSGAVEQLRVHVRNLGMLVNSTQSIDKPRKIELFEKGYGKDAAGIAKDAILFAKEHGFDVVLIDTAGRMQDNEPLMRALAKLVATNNPDKIVFVGEALVGNEAVDQLTKFDRALKDFSGKNGGSGGRGLDGMLITKWDTVDDKVGAALSMTFVTGQPILFVGCGQVCGVGIWSDGILTFSLDIYRFAAIARS